jgi:D-tyrosyl-tRNA(Tyr) deacylase
VKVVVQRVSRAEVRIAGKSVGKIGAGFVVLVGFAPTDTADSLAWMADKLLGLRVFGDAEGKMNLALSDVGGGVLVVSQFTLYGDVKKGRERGAGSGVQVATGEFGAMMEVDLVNDGPVTLILER